MANGIHSEFSAFVTDEDAQMTVRAWAERQGYPGSTVQTGGPGAFAQALENSAPPKLALIDIDGQENPVASIQRLLTLCADCKIVAVGSANDVGLYRRILGAGATDYLVKPLANDALNQALASALRGDKTGKGVTHEAKVIVVVGTRGGVGASTAAVNLGWILSHQMKSNVALIDLDLQFGTSSLALDLEPGRGLRDIVSSPQRVDSLMITSSMVNESETFAVLAAEEAVDEFVPMDGGALTALLKELTPKYDYIVIDLPRHLISMQKRLLAAAHTIVLVTELSLAGIRDTLRIKTALGVIGCTASLIFAASRVGSARMGQVDASAFEKGAQIKIDLTLPEDHKAVAASANGGKALAAIAPAAPITKALEELAEKIAGKHASGKEGLVQKMLAGLARRPKPDKNSHGDHKA